MSNQKVYKANCNGNDFIIILKDDLIKPLDKNFIINVCKRTSGIGSHGLLLIDTYVDGYDFRMDYFNNDGTWETFCGNGALCALKLLIQKNFKFKKNLFLAGDGEHSILINQGIKLKMKIPSFQRYDVMVGGYLGSHVDSGAKHFATIVNRIDTLDLFKIAQDIRYHNLFSPDGINVNFVSINKLNNINVTTYEKGVEEIMPSCASGSVAAAYYINSKKKLESPLTIHSIGGEMVLEFNDKWNDLWISSNPIIEFSTEF